MQGFEGQGGKFKLYTAFIRGCLRSSFEDSGDVRYCWYKTTRTRCTLDSSKASCVLK